MSSASDDVTIVVYSLFCAQMLLYGVCFFYFAWKEIQPIKARSKVLLAAEYLGLFFLCMATFFTMIEVDSCASVYATGWLFSFVLITSIFVRVLRLLLIFNLNRNRLLEKSTEASFLTDPKIVSELSMFLLFCAIFSLFIIYRIFTFTYQVVHEKEPPSEACGSPAPEFAAVRLIIVGFKLRRVHDAYFIKREFLCLLAVAFVILVAYLIALSSPSKSPGYYAGIWLLLLMFHAIAIVSYGVPSYMSYKTWRYNSSHGSNSLESSNTATEIFPDDARVTFKGYSKAREWISDPIGMKYIEKYIVHYQDIESGDYLLLWTQLNEFLKAPDEFLTARASLLYQKFIKQDAYRYIAFITQEQREKIKNLLDEAMKEEAAPINRDIFDEILEELETLLIQRVFKGFSSSPFFVEYKEALILSSVK